MVKKGEADMEKEGMAHTSARNKLRGVITAIKRGDVMCQVEMRVGDNHVVAVITSEAADEMGLQVGMEAVAMFKSTSVMIAAPTGDNGSGL
jgi:molybdopterin-binding protein